jgi:aspartyl-tRNA(Asn)/glutamyl-tRNA(Gln) amidotransferase subunit A
LLIGTADNFEVKEMAKLISRREVLAGVAAGVGAALLGCSRSNTVNLKPAPDLTQLDLNVVSGMVRSGEISPVELTRACLERIDRLDPEINSFITVTREQAMADARHAENEITNKRWLGPLHGIPIAIKDNVDTAGVLTTAASALFANRVPTEDATVVKRLKAAGAVILGKLNMHEFAGGTTSAISYYGPVRNPWNLDYIAGGSSGGSAAAVAAGLCFGAVGTDTGGSIRIPAACCGVVGLKPTYDVVSTEGIIYVSRSFDHVGPICRTVTDTTLMFRAMTDHSVASESDLDSPPSMSQLRVGVVTPKVPLCDADVDPEVLAVVDEAIAVVRSLVGVVRKTELPMPDVGDIISAENYRAHAKYLDASPELYDPKTRQDIMAGKRILQTEYVRMIKELDVHRRTIDEAFSGVDVVVLPTLSTLPLTVKDANDPFSLNACTFAFSTGGIPSISIPCGFSKSGLPVGLLIGGPHLSEPRILALAMAYEKIAGWDKRRPIL